MTNTSISRRGFTRILGVGAAGAALRPSGVFAALTTTPARPTPRSAGAEIVRLSSNENPYGPSPAALKAMADSFGLAWRYPDEHGDLLIEELTKLHGVSSGQILLGAGSGEILKLCAAAFTGKDKKLVVPNPTFESIARHANVAGAEVVKIDLTSAYHHDLPRMLTASSDAGLVYICNPNNPTAKITPKDDIKTFLAKLPSQTIVLVDEAYHHYVEISDYESVIPFVKDFPNLIVTRTFSKIYGMAGLRCGYCVTRSENVSRMRAHQSFDSVNIMALVAALASIRDTTHVATGRAKNTEVKRYLYGQFDKLGFRYIPSDANFMMIDLRREVRPVIAALEKRNVQVGRFFPPLPNFMRVTIGTKPQMESFLAAFREVLPA